MAGLLTQAMSRMRMLGREKEVKSDDGRDKRIASKLLERKLNLDGFVDDDEWISDEEEEKSRIGSVPLWYYKDEEHIGYDISGARIEQKFKLEGSEIDRLIENADNPDAWRTITDVKNQTQTRLTDTDLEIIRRLRTGKLGISPMGEEIVQFEYSDSKQPLHRTELRKSQFTPSIHEQKKINHFIKLIRTGRMYKPVVKKSSTDDLVDLWGDNISKIDDQKSAYRQSLPAPKPNLPGHAASYNPPKEYLFTSEEEKQWNEQHPLDRKLDFIPKAHQSLRHVGSYDKLVEQLFERCLDLYLCPRTVRKEWIQNSDDLLPSLPSLDSLRPFPERQALLLRSEGSGVTSLKVSKDGALVAAGTRDGSLMCFSTAAQPYCLPLFYFKTNSDGPHYALNGVSFHPTLPLLLFTRAKYLYVALLRPTHMDYEDCQDLIAQHWGQTEVEESNRATDMNSRHATFIKAVKLMALNSESVQAAELAARPKSVGAWRSFRSEGFFDQMQSAEIADSDGHVSTDVSEDEDTAHEVLGEKDWTETHRFVKLLSASRHVICGYVVSLGGPASSLDIHCKGVYVATASSKCTQPSHQCLLHSLTKKVSRAPYKKSTRSDVIQSAKFHPTEPWLAIGFSKATLVFNLQAKPAISDPTQKSEMGVLVKRFKGVDQVTGMDLHPSGEHLLRIGLDGKMHWFDFEYGHTPYKTMQLSEGPMTSLCVHPTMPLVAVGCADGGVQMIHADTKNGVFGEVALTPLIKLSDKRGHVTALSWTHDQPWLVSGHSNGRIVFWV